MGQKHGLGTEHSVEWTAALRLVAEVAEGGEPVMVVGSALTSEGGGNDFEFVQHEYSVRLEGMALWDDHLQSLAAARRSALEPFAMGLTEIHIVDDTTGRMIE